MASDNDFDDDSSLGVGQVELKEEWDPDYEPTAQDMADYAKGLGLDLDEDPDLAWIARAGLKDPLPADWKPCQDTTTGDIYYFNFSTGESLWDHPCDVKYKALYEEEKAKKLSAAKSAASDRPKTARRDGDGHHDATFARPTTSKGGRGDKNQDSASGVMSSMAKDLLDQELSPTPTPFDNGRAEVKVFGRMDDDLYDNSEYSESDDGPVRNDIIIDSKYGSAVLRDKPWTTVPDPTEGMAKSPKVSARSMLMDDHEEERRKLSASFAEELASLRQKHAASIASAKSETDNAIRAEQKASEAKLAEVKHKAAASLKDAKVKLDAEHADAIEKFQKKLEQNMLTQKQSAEKDAKVKLEKEIEASMKTARADLATRKIEITKRHELELSELDSSLAVQKAERKMELKNKAAKELTQLEEKHAAELATQKSRITAAHSNSLAEFKSNGESASQVHSKLISEMETKRAQQRQELSDAMAAERRMKELELQEQLQILEREHTLKISEKKKQYDEEDSASIAAIKAKSASMRLSIKQEEEAKLKELQAEIQELRAACDSEKRQIEEERERLSTQNAQLQTDIDMLVAGIQNNKSQLDQVQSNLVSGRSELAMLTNRNAELADLIKKQEERLAELVAQPTPVDRAAAAAPSDHGRTLNLADLSQDEEPVSIDVRNQHDREGQNSVHVKKVKIEQHSKTPTQLDYGSEDSYDSDGSINPNDEYDEYMAKARQCLQRLRSRRRGGREADFAPRVQMGRSTAEVLADVNQILGDDPMYPATTYNNWVYLDGGDDVALPSRLKGAGDLGRTSVLAAQTRARHTVQNLTTNGTRANDLFEKHSNWLHQFRDTMHAARIGGLSRRY